MRSICAEQSKAFNCDGITKCSSRDDAHQYKCHRWRRWINRSTIALKMAINTPLDKCILYKP